MRLAAFAAGLLFLGGSAQAQNRPGDFDFYVISLSWSPSYCAAEKARADNPQCSGERPHAFVVHGLWPQYERGFPEHCAQNAPRIPQSLIDGMLDLMPSGGLVVQQWRKHGLCSGLSAADYSATVRRAAQAVSIPGEFTSGRTARMVSPPEVEAAFLGANPDLRASGIAVSCDGAYLREVRVCLTPDLGFRSCPEIDRRSCRADRIAMPANGAAR